MAATDYKSSSPVRSEADGIDARVQVKVVDKTSPGTQQMTVDSDSNAHAEMHTNDPSGVDRVLRTSELGALTPDGIYDASNNTLPGTVGITAQTRNATASPTRQAQLPTAKRGTVDTDTVSQDVSLHDENGNAFSTTNPLPVAISNDEGGTPVHSYNETASTIAVAGSQSITYTVAGTAFTFKRLVVSASGRCKVEVFAGAVGSPPQKYTLFLTSTSPVIALDIPKNFVVAVADVVKVTFTNIDEDVFTGYATFEGSLA